ncbi:MAG: RimJ/RimL family protein N-acetyltransferase [Salibacteraceae bacterium]
MIVEFEDLYIRGFEESDLEMIRQWRNNPIVKRHLYHQEEISAEKQLLWYETQKKTSNKYFILGVKRKDIGMISLSDFAKNGKACTSNIFIGELDYLNNQYPIIASFVFCEMGFDLLKIEEVRAEVLTSNEGAIRLNDFLGFKKVGLDELKRCIVYSFNPELYNEKRPKLLKLIKLYYNTTQLEMKVRKSYFNLESDEIEDMSTIKLS